MNLTLKIPQVSQAVIYPLRLPLPSPISLPLPSPLSVLLPSPLSLPLPSPLSVPLLYPLSLPLPSPLCVLQHLYSVCFSPSPLLPPSIPRSYLIIIKFPYFSPKYSLLPLIPSPNPVSFAPPCSLRLLPSLQVSHLPSSALPYSFFPYSSLPYSSLFLPISPFSSLISLRASSEGSISVVLDLSIKNVANNFKIQMYNQKSALLKCSPPKYSQILNNLVIISLMKIRTLLWFHTYNTNVNNCLCVLLLEFCYLSTLSNVFSSKRISTCLLLIFYIWKSFSFRWYKAKDRHLLQQNVIDFSTSNSNPYCASCYLKLKVLFKLVNCTIVEAQLPKINSSRYLP